MNAIVQHMLDADAGPAAAPAAPGPVAAAPTPFRFTGYNKFLDPDGYPAVAPPWGTLSAIDLNTAEYAWQIPLGEYPELVAKGIRNTGSENYGGPIVTAGGLVFIGATNFDRKFRALDKKTGKLLWETTLPFSGNATPATLRGGRTAVRGDCGRRREGRPRIDVGRRLRRLRAAVHESPALSDSRSSGVEGPAALTVTTLRLCGTAARWTARP